MKVLCKFADKAGPSNNLVVSWDEAEGCVVFSMEDAKEPWFLRLLPETLEQIADAVTVQRMIPP